MIVTYFKHFVYGVHVGTDSTYSTPPPPFPPFQSILYIIYIIYIAYIYTGTTSIRILLRKVSVHYNKYHTPHHHEKLGCVYFLNVKI